VRTIVERLARRCGYDAVAAAMPAGDKRLLQHIRRETLRKQRLRADVGSQVRGSCDRGWQGPRSPVTNSESVKELRKNVYGAAGELLAVINGYCFLSDPGQSR